MSKAYGFRAWGWYSPIASTFIVHSPEDLKYAFRTNFDNYDLSNRKAAFQDILGDGIFNSDGPMWKEQRRVSSHMFTARQLKDHSIETFVRNARKVCKILSEVKPGEAVDIQ
eukprot:Sspe_Gene.24757::Locus_9847_Transcript_1_1_Confidence_1.000_Length_598::g.24757::m.24757